MRRRLALVLLAACGPAPRDTPPPDVALAIDTYDRPDGVWEPDLGTGRTGAFLVGDDTGIWFTYGHDAPMGASEVWLTKTTSTGEVLVPPMRIDGPEQAGWPEAITRSGDSIAVLWKHSDASSSPRVRLFALDGQPRSAAGNLVPVSTIEQSYLTNLALAPRPGSALRMFAAYKYSAMTTEIALVDLDATGSPIGQATLFGTADGSTPTGLAAVDVAGTSTVAWDRRYNICQGYNDPDATLHADVASDGSIGAANDVSPSGLGDREPTLAAVEGAAYLAWTSDTDAGSVVRLAKVGSPGLGVADVGLAPFGNSSPKLALSDATHGAVAWTTDEPTIRIAKVTNDGARIVVDAPHVIPFDTSISLRGIVHVAGDTYVISWTEDSYTPSLSRLFAVTVDLAVAPKQIDGAPERPLHSVRPKLRCSH